MRQLTKIVQVISCTLLGVSCANVAYAAWPDDQPIRVIVPQSAGGTNDMVARLIGTELGKALSQSVVVENRVGASGSIGTQAIAQASPDGYTIGIASDSSTIAGAVRPSLPWQFNRDLTGISMVGDQPICVSVSSKTPYKTLSELLSAAKKNPDTIAFASSGAGSSQHIVGAWLSKLAGVSLIHIPYKGGGQAITDLVGNQVPAAVLGCAPVMAQYKAGSVRVLAVTSAQRNAALPEVPTLTELGYPDIALAQWVGFVAPKNTPDTVIERLSTEIAKILAKPEIRQKLLESGLDPRPMPSQRFDSFLLKTVQQWGGLVKELNLQME